jgi:large subunit ribosomal protein L1
MSSYGSVLPSAARGILSSCRAPLRETSIAPVLSTFQQVRGLKSKPKSKGKEQPVKKGKGPQEFTQKNLKDMPQWALCDAMRYVLNT